MEDLSKFKLNQIVVHARIQQDRISNGKNIFIIEDPTEVFAIEQHILKESHERSCARCDLTNFVVHVKDKYTIVSQSGKCWKTFSKPNLPLLDMKKTYKMLIGLREINVWSSEQDYGANWELIALQVDDQQWDQLITPVSS
jgi:hypothetical protein